MALGAGAAELVRGGRWEAERATERAAWRHRVSVTLIR